MRVKGVHGRIPHFVPELVLAAQHESSISKLDLCFPDTHRRFSLHGPSILSLFPINHHFSHGLRSSWALHTPAPFPPTLLKAAQPDACQVAFPIHHAASPRLCVSLVGLSCLLRCSSGTSHWCLTPTSPGARVTCWGLSPITSPAAWGQLAAPCCATREW